MLLSTQEDKWVPANSQRILSAKGNLRFLNIPQMKSS